LILVLLALATAMLAAPALSDDPPASNAPKAKAQATDPKDQSGPEPRREPSASEILKKLTENAPGRPIVQPVRPGQVRRETLAVEALPRNSLVPVTIKLLPDGYRLVDRPGRLAREADFFVFAFESRGQAEAEPPIRLLPNRLLEDVEAASQGGTVQVVFIVSGEVTEYHGVNYLLLQKVVQRPELGNLK
jgi:hypothetical protein